MILHQILLETDKTTPLIKETQKHCEKKSREYQYDYILWTNDNISTIENDDNYKDYIGYAQKLFVRTSIFYLDILRFCIVHKYGGTYLDCDYIIEKDFKELVQDSYFTVSEFLKNTYIIAFFYGVPNNDICKNFLDTFLITPEYFFADSKNIYPSRTIHIIMHMFTLSVNLNKSKVNIIDDDYMATNPSNYVKGKSYARHLRFSSWKQVK